jgi:hypothetical protein
MDGIACEKDSTLRITLCHYAAPRPQTGTQPFHIERAADRSANESVSIDGLRRLLPACRAPLAATSAKPMACAPPCMMSREAAAPATIRNAIPDPMVASC